MITGVPSEIRTEYLHNKSFTAELAALSDNAS
jgi:hypothetical protein